MKQSIQCLLRFFILIFISSLGSVSIALAAQNPHASGEKQSSSLGSVSIALAAPSKAVFVLFDVSESTDKTGVREQYMKDFKTILKSIHPGDAIAADRISESSASGSTLPINKEFESTLKSNRFKTSKAIANILEEADGILKRPDKVKYTDILGSLQIAERIFATYGKERNILVIMSDMVEDSSNYNFDKEKLTDKRIMEIINREKKANRLPDLQNVKVYAVKSATGQSREIYTCIENFWMRYFKECGGQINKAQYGPLTKFE
jgi:hypothetical protein